MALVVPDASIDRLLEQIVNKTAVQDLVCRLYSNDYTPVAGSVVGNFTEVSGSGYAAISLTASEWVVATQDNAHPAISFEFTSSFGTVYGYYLTEATSGLLVWAERFSSPPNVNKAGLVTVTLHLTGA